MMARFINEYKPVASVGDCINVDVLVSITHGLIAQMSVFITCQRFQYTCMRMEDHSDFTYVHVLKFQTGY